MIVQPVVEPTDRFTALVYSDLSALLDRHSAALPLGNLAALLVRDLAAVRLRHVAAVVDRDGLAVLAWGVVECYLVRSSSVTQHSSPVRRLSPSL